MRLINADELYELLDNGFDVDMDELPETKAALLQMIAEQPTVEERKTGMWIYHDDDDMRFDTYHCSVCRKMYTVDAGRFDDIGFVKEDLKFCPNCGAKMEDNT